MQKKYILSPLLASLFLLNACGSKDTPPIEYPQVYLSVFSSNLINQCSVINDTGYFLCNRLDMPNNLYLPIGATLNGPTGIAINNNYIYIASSGFNPKIESATGFITQCTIDKNNNNQLNNCILYTESVTYPVGITIHGVYAYIANYGADYESDATYTLCNISFQNGQLEHCSLNNLSTASGRTFTASTPEFISFYESFAYISDQANDGYIACQESGNGTLINCTLPKVFESSVESNGIGPRGSMVDNGYIYFINSAWHGESAVKSALPSYTYCPLSQIESDGTLNNCLTDMSISNLLNSPTGIARYGNYVYITNEGESIGSYVSCSTNESGPLRGCNKHYTASNVGTPGYTYFAFSK